MGGRDTDDWVLSRLIQLRYVQESESDDTTFVCTLAGRHRWQIEVMADEKRNALALRRLLIRRRLDERFTRLGIDTSTALTPVCLPEPRLHRRMPAPWNPPSQRRMRLSSPLATVFATTAAALVVISASANPQEAWNSLFAPKPHAAVVLTGQLKANMGGTVLVGSPAAAAAVVPAVRHAEKARGHSAEAADAAPVDTQRVASIEAISPSGNKGDNAPYQGEQDVGVPNRTLTEVEPAGRQEFAVADAASREGGAIVNSAATAMALMDIAAREGGHIATALMIGTARGFGSTAVSLIDAAARESGQIATDGTAGFARYFKPVPATLMYTLAGVGRTVSEWIAGTRQIPEEAPAVVTSHTQTGSVWAATDPASPDERAAATGVPARRVEASVDPQHAAVERLNTLSLAAARRGEAWRPNSRPM